jgi:hypothetical protein
MEIPVCHSEPFACHSEQSEESHSIAQDQLREESHRNNELKKDSSAATSA